MLCSTRELQNPIINQCTERSLEYWTGLVKHTHMQKHTRANLQMHKHQPKMSGSLSLSASSLVINESHSKCYRCVQLNVHLFIYFFGRHGPSALLPGAGIQLNDTQSQDSFNLVSLCPVHLVNISQGKRFCHGHVDSVTGNALQAQSAPMPQKKKRDSNVRHFVSNSKRLHLMHIFIATK